MSQTRGVRPHGLRRPKRIRDRIGQRIAPGSRRSTPTRPRNTWRRWRRRSVGSWPSKRDLARTLCCDTCGGAHLVAIPCNSALPLGPTLEARLRMPVLTPWACAPALIPSRRICVLGSSSSRPHLEGPAPELVFPNDVDQAIVQACIEGVMAGRLTGAELPRSRE